ncbi:MAG: polyprenol monophosphomannose synthase [Dehalococcoidia bacterium]|nr:polyprenol monophosphomannose synthase [Dehalococcoidia bacterium]
MKAVVVTPTYNEAENLPMMVDAVKALGIEGLQLLVVDDNSPDKTGEIADQLARRYPDFFAGVIHRPRKMGLGTAYIAGFRYCLELGADYIIQMDTDLSHPPGTLPVLLEMIKEYDVVAGSRYIKGGRLGDTWGLGRRLLSAGGNLYARLFTGLPMKDVTGGFRCFRRVALASIDLEAVRSTGFAFQIEIAYACHKNGCSIKEVPIVFNDRAHGRSKMSLDIVWEAFWTVWRVRTRY